MKPKILPLFVVMLALKSVTIAQSQKPADATRWWKGNLHTHTLWSDGDGFPDMVADWYREHGYHFLALSDHNVLSEGERWMDVKTVVARANGDRHGELSGPRVDPMGSYVDKFGKSWVKMRKMNGEEQVRLKTLDECRRRFEETGRFLMIPAEELTLRAANGVGVHMGAVNLLEFLAPRRGATVREVMENNLQAAAASRGGRQVLVHVNHPNYEWGVTAEVLASVVSGRFFEVWNGIENDADRGDAHHPSTEEIWDIANTLRLAGFKAPPLYGLANDDTHDSHDNKSRALPGRAWIMVRSRTLTADALIHAMRAGAFYASTGVVLEDATFDPKTRRLSLRIQPQESETYVTRFIGTRRGVNLQGQPRRDENGAVVETTLDYRTASGPQIGEVLREEAGVNPSYTLSGDELYVRAVVESSGRTVVPSKEYPFKRAWTQPVGWSVQATPVR